MSWPINTSGKIVEATLGSPRMMLLNAGSVSREKNKARQQNRRIDYLALN
jgi:hypothetical protein